MVVVASVRWPLLLREPGRYADMAFGEKRLRLLRRWEEEGRLLDAGDLLSMLKRGPLASAETWRELTGIARSWL